ncbi:MAG: biopolymer transporter ExbD [Chitinophagaceae bacterium]|nr:biopolymer transporter ExbD [Chitinophagaceae bacterium]
MKLRKKHKDESEVFTDALNDILFILLMFFLIVSTLANPNVRKASLPKAKSNTKAKQSVAVTIDSFNRFYVEAKPVDVLMMDTVLAQMIRSKRTNGEEPTISINADRNCKLESFAAVLRAADRLGVKAVMNVDKKGVE